MDHLVGRFFKAEQSLVIAGDSTICVVDPGYSHSSVEDVLSACRTYNKTVSHVILSHAHSDHVANVKHYLKAFPSLNIVCSPYSPFRKLKGAVLCSHGEMRRIADVDLRFLHTPGHTSIGDDISVYVPFDRLLFCGDLAQPQGGSYDRGTFASPVPFYHDGDAYIKSLDTLLGLGFHTMMTGHGDVLSDNQARNWLCVTKSVVERSRDLAFKLVRAHPSTDDNVIAEWVFRTIGNERGVDSGRIEARLQRTDGESDYKFYDLPGILYWIRSWRSVV